MRTGDPKRIRPGDGQTRADMCLYARKPMGDGNAPAVIDNDIQQERLAEVREHV